MPHIKTAISIEAPIFEQVDTLAKELNISRSRVFALAVQEFVQRHQNIKLLEALNNAYDDFPDSEPQIISRMRPRHHKMVNNQW